ncbi:MAG: nucleotidyltransferase domain-containing protein, partial [Burkholderiales bacterium]
MAAAQPEPGTPVAQVRAELQAARDALREVYLRRPRPHALLRGHSKLIDRTIKAMWREAQPAVGAVLAATGGYGRGELFPFSDIDVLILLAREPSTEERGRLERLVGQLWDVGLEVGHSVRTITACLEAAEADITVRTTLLEARFLAGSPALYRKLEVALQRAFDPASFYKAKKLEQEQRHAKHQDTAYSLEPNLKEAPGGLRDLHVIKWIARAAGIVRGWRDLESHGLIQQDEMRQLSRSETLLQNLRIRLHYLAGRREDRLVFDHQSTLAAQLGDKETPTRRASEVMMQRYYRTAKTIIQ